MEKIIYWLKKLGLLRSASYKVKGSADKLNEVNATDGGMIQSQEQIDKEYEEKTGDRSSSKSEKKGGKILFWIFFVLAAFFFVVYLGGGFSFGSFVSLVLWCIFLFFLKKGTASWTTSVVKVLVLGLILVFLSLMMVDTSDESKKISDGEDVVSSEVKSQQNIDQCDNSNSEYASFNGVEEVIVSENPCDVPWILAKAVENYELKTKKGTTLKVTVFNNYVNNVQAGESYTIRALDVDESLTGQEPIDAGISIVRWVPNKSALYGAKDEVKKIVEKLNY